MSEAPFQTNTHLSLKKRIKRETQYRIKASNHLFTEQKNRKKKKRSKNPSDNTRLSIKKKNRKKRSTILKKTAIHSGNKETQKKKKKEAKTRWKWVNYIQKPCPCMEKERE